jgi:predicted RNA polymerase sigma factor
MELGDHLFRQEAGRMVAALTRVFGIHNLALAEDVVQDAFCRALEVWKFRGVPENPSAWLMATAKHRAIDVLRRERTARTFAPELGRLLESEWTLVPVVEELFGSLAVKDDLLRMMFSCCNPRLAEEAQVGLVLHILCGFGINEIAAAFLDTEAATQKRIVRAKKVLAGSKRLFDLADADFSQRLSAVHRALYLLFNEGYHGASAESAVQVELCHEAIRLVRLLLEHPPTATAETYALGALMSLHASRLPARISADGKLQTLFEQDRSCWDASLIEEGLRLLERSADSQVVAEFQIEAAIAAVHARAARTELTSWVQIVYLYDALMRIRPSPIVALNRAIAVAQHEGPERGLQELAAIEDSDRLSRYPFYFAAMGDLELRCGRHTLARQHFGDAVERARNQMEREFFEQRMRACERIGQEARERQERPEG